MISKQYLILLVTAMFSICMGMENEQKSGKKITIQSTKEDWERLKAIVSKLEKTTHSIQWCLEKEHKTKEEYKKNNNNNNKG